MGCKMSEFSPNLAASILAGSFFIFGFSKLRSIMPTARWIQSRWAIRSINVWVIVFALAIISAIEIGVAAYLMVAERHLIAALAVLSVFMMLGVIVNKFLFSGYGGCPCLGIDSIANEEKSLYIALLSSVAVLLILAGHELFNESHWVVRPEIFVIITFIYLTGHVMGRMSWGGVRVVFGNQWRDFDDQNSVILFLSIDCDLCMRILKFLEDNQGMTNSAGKFYLLIKGMKNTDVMKFKNALVLPDEDETWRRFRISLKPTLVALDRGRVRKFVGSHQILGELARQAYDFHGDFGLK